MKDWKKVLDDYINLIYCQFWKVNEKFHQMMPEKLQKRNMINSNSFKTGIINPILIG